MTKEEKISAIDNATEILHDSYDKVMDILNAVSNKTEKAFIVRELLDDLNNSTGILYRWKQTIEKDNAK